MMVVRDLHRNAMLIVAKQPQARAAENPQLLMMTVIMPSRVIMVMVRLMLVTLLVPALLMPMMMIVVVPMIVVVSMMMIVVVLMIMGVPMPMRTFIGLERRRHLDGPEPVLSH